MAADISFLRQLNTIGIIPHNQHELVYKYTDFETAVKILSNYSFRFRTPATFNDPLEFNPDCLCLDISQEEFEKKLHFDLQNREGVTDFSARENFIRSKSIAEFQNAYKTTIKHYRHKFLVFCTSSAFDKTLMWTHYGKNHTGICFGISLPNFDEGLGSISLKVNYSMEIEPKQVLTTDENQKSLALYYWIYTKSKDWEYEDEIRTIINLDALDIDLNGQDYKDVRLAEGQLNTIYYGCRTPPQCIKMIEGIIREKGYQIDRYLMQPAPGTFKFEAVPYNHLD